MEQNSKNIFITGVASGLGQNLLERFYADGFQVTGVVRQSEQKQNLLGKYSDRLNVHLTDLSQREQVKNLTKEIQDISFDYIVLNAGVATTGVFHELDEESFESLLETNLISNMRLVHAMLPQALANGTKIVFVSSIVARMAGSNYASYSVSKAGLSHFYNSLKKEYPQLPLLCIEIGPVDTPIHAKASNHPKSKKMFKSCETIGERLYHAIQHKTGVTALSWDWNVLRRIAIAFTE